MKKISTFCTTHGVQCIWWIGCAMTVAVTVMRVITVPLSRDPDTGRFTVNMVVIAVALLATAVMALVARLGDKSRVDIGERAARPLAAAALAAGVLVGVNGLYDLLAWYMMGRVPPPQTAMIGAVPVVLMMTTSVLAVAAGVVLVLFSRQIFSARGTREGMCSWELLVPVLWMWFRLTRYLMSYASAVQLDECVYDFGMFVAELLFLFKFARFISGIGKTTVAGLMAYAMGAAVWVLSAPLSRVCLYVMGDTQAYLAGLAGVSDLAVGVLAVVFAGGLWYCAYHDDPPASDDVSSDASSDVSEEPAVEEPSEDGTLSVEELILRTMDE